MPVVDTKREANAEQLEMRHRNPAARDYVVVSLVVLVGYSRLSDGAKLTYWVIYSHDWFEASRGARKGYAYPSVARLAQLRHTAARTVQRHLAELIHAGLLTREFRLGKPSILYIEEPGNAEVEAYLRAAGRGDDIAVRGGVTKVSPHKQEEKKQKESVNGVEELGSKTAEHVDYLVGEILKVCRDERSRVFYRMIARFVPDETVFKALSEVVHDGPIQNRGALFVSKVKPFLGSRGQRGAHP